MVTLINNESENLLEQKIEKVFEFLVSQNLSVMQATLERLIMTYNSLSNKDSSSVKSSATEQQVQIIVRRLKNENRADFAEAVSVLLSKVTALAQIK